MLSASNYSYCAVDKISSYSECDALGLISIESIMGKVDEAYSRGTQLFDDIKRTEHFARLAYRNSHTLSACQTILKTPQLWWITISYGFSRKRNGGRISWTTILSCLVNVLAFIVISLLSSVLLNVNEIRITRPLVMTRLIPKSNSALTPVAERETFFRTTGALLQNVTTSP